MIYIIDDRKSRQIDYGWTDTRFAKYQNVVIPIWNLSDLKTSKEEILQNGNIVLFHESFFSSCNKEKQSFIDGFKEELINNSNLYVALFSGSKNSRFVDNRLCMLPPNVLYENLGLFIESYIANNVNLRVLAFGNNFLLEEDLRKRLKEINFKNSEPNLNKLSPLHSVFFAAAADAEQELEVEPPFKNINKVDSWDNFSSDVSDTDLDELVHQWFDETRYDAIYIPLSFGNTLSDFIGLRLAMHIRLTPSINDKIPIFIYGVASYEEIIQHECLDILKTSSVHLIGCDNESFLNSLQIERREENANYINKIHLNLPSNLGDNHSVANKWAISRWVEMIKWDVDMPQLFGEEFSRSLYFKYLSAKFGEHDKFKKKNKCDVHFSGIEGKRIVYIDDEYDKGWESILQYICQKNGAELICFKDFNKQFSREELIHKIQTFVDENDADCYLLDLRLHESDFIQGEELTGHTISRYIKNLNLGNQIVVFTASNKVWNLKKELFKIGATSYILKESPELNLKRIESEEIFKEFTRSIRLACNMSYIKELIALQDELKQITESAIQLDAVINLLLKDNLNNDKGLLGAILLAEMVFLEDFIENQLKFKKNSTGKGDAIRVEIYNDTIQELVTGHVFFRREKIGKNTNIIEVSNYHTQVVKCPDGWCNVFDTQITLIVACLYIIFGLSRNQVQQYVDLKYIRNTQIAHKDSSITRLNTKVVTTEQVVKFYKEVIYPIVIASKEM